MKPRPSQLSLIFIGVLIFTSIFQAPVIAEITPPGQVHLLSSSESGLVFEVPVPWQTLQTSLINIDDETFTRLDLPGWIKTSQPGAPELPYLTQSIGVPFDADLSIRVYPGESHTIALSAPPIPSVTPKLADHHAENLDNLLDLPAVEYIHAANPAVYHAQEPYPAQLAEITLDGVMRSQRIAGIAIYPVVFNPQSNTITIYESLQIKVGFGGSRSTSQFVEYTESDAYDTLFQNTLLNYDQAQHWQKPQDQILDSYAEIRGSSLASGTRATTPWQPPNPGWRIAIQADGLYQLSYANLQAAGLPVDTLNPKTFQMFYQGDEIAIEVTGEADLSFDPGDAIRFYGQAISSKYAADNIYWLTYGQANGRRMASRDGTPVGVNVPTHFTAHLHMEENHVYNGRAPGDDDLERFLWNYIHTSIDDTWIHKFQLTNPYDGSGTLTINLLGGLQVQAVNPDHHAVISLNGSELASVWWDGITWKTVQMEIPPGLLKPGENEIKVFLPNDTGYGTDYIFVDWIELNFSNTFTADTGTNQLDFTFASSGTWKYQVEGFTTNDLFIYDVSDPNSVAAMINYQVVPSGPGYAAVFGQNISSPKTFWVAAGSAIKHVPASQIEKDNPSNLGAGSNQAKYLIITHTAFYSEAQDLADYRISTGVKTKLIDVQDIYDEFAFGVVSPTAIRDFLAYTTTNWGAPAPTYVLLIGDGHYDPKNYLGNNRTSFIPAYLANVDPWIGETAADNRYVTIVGTDNMPDMMLGRLSVNTPLEANAFIQKIRAYEQTPPAGDWPRQVLAVAAAADSAGNFANISDNLIRQTLPAHFNAEKVYYEITHKDLAEAQAALKAGINQGSLIVNFIGHAFSTGWSAKKNPPETFIRTTDVPNLNNQGKYPIILAMTCSEGAFHHPTTQAMGEVITRAENKGAIASWSPTGQGTTGGHDFLNHGFFDAVFKDSVVTLGEAVNAGLLRLWSSGSSLYLLDTYVLFGDPALKILRLPTNADDNQAPTDITLSNNTVPEKEPVNTVVGTFSTIDPDLSDTHTYTLVSGQGSTDNASFNISVSSLRTSAVFDYKTKNSYSIRVRSTDVGGLYFEKVFIINVTNVNEAPTNISLSNNTVPENAPVNTVVGTLSTSDPDVGDTHTYTLVSGEGSIDNASFNVSGNSLRTSAVFDYETKNSYSIRVRSTDAGGLFFEKVFTINVTNVNEAPTNISLSNNTVPEDAPVNTVVGTLSTSDPDVGDTHTYTLVSGEGSTDNASFNISGNSLRTSAVFDYETKNSYSIRVRSTDAGSLYFERVFTIQVYGLNKPPIAVDDAYQTDMNQTLIVDAPGILANDSDPEGDELSAIIDIGTSNGTLTLSSNGAFTYIPNSGFSGLDQFTYMANDGELNSNIATVTITVIDPNQAPTHIFLSNNFVLENAPVNTVVGTLSTFDPDEDDTHTYTLVSGEGSTDNASFNISENSLRTSAVFDYETKNSYSIRVRSTDAGGLYYEKVFTISVLKVDIGYPLFLPLIFK